MHELSICRSLRRLVEQRADGRTVRCVHVRVGELRQVVPDTLAFAWTVATRDTALAGARLEIEHRPVLLRCHRCDAETALSTTPIRCACGSADVEVIGGDELDVVALDVVAA